MGRQHAEIRLSIYARLSRHNSEQDTIDDESLARLRERLVAAAAEIQRVIDRDPAFREIDAWVHLAD